jgi:hypothetical protein
MKKILLVIAMLIIAAPVLATVSVTATDKGSGVVEFRYNCSAAEKVRAFALDITVDNGLTIRDIRDFNTGESKVPGGGYGIFPGKFADYVNASSPNWADTNYTPLGRTSDPSTKSGLGTGAITVELGTLYVDVNAPGVSGLLFRLDVNGNGAHDGNLSIALNNIRGGIVLEDASLAPSPVLTGTKLTFLSCTTPTNEVGQTTTAAVAVWQGQGFNSTNGIPVVNCANVGLVITNDQNCVTTSTTVNYTYGIQATVPNEVNQVEATATANIIAAGLTLGVRTTACSNTIATGKVISTNPTSGTVTCGAVAYVVSTGPCDCFPSSDPAYSDWVSFGKPACWCNLRQCHGDADGLAQGTTKSGLYYVGTNDLSVLIAAWQVLEPPNGPGIATISVGGIPGICADFAHDAQGTTKSGIYRVGTNDLSRMITYWQVLEPPNGTGTPADCPHN